MAQDAPLNEANGGNDEDEATEILDDQPQFQPFVFAQENWHIDTLALDPKLFTQLVSATSQPHEVGGLLIGQRDRSHSAVNVLGFVFPKQSKQTSVYCAFDTRWASVMKAAIIECDLHPEVTLVAWIHTHPQISVFLSGTDVRTIDELQQYNPLTLAVVLDPFNGDMGAFHFDRQQRDTRIEYTPLTVDAVLAQRLRRLKKSRQVRMMSKSWFLTDAKHAERVPIRQ